MLIEQPRLASILIFLLPAIILQTAQNSESLSEGLRSFFWLAKYPLYALSGLSLLDWFWNRTVIYTERLKRAVNATKLSEAAERLSGLDEERLRILKISLGIDLEPDQGKGVTYIDGVPIPDDWIQRFFFEADGLKLPPLRNYADGSVDRERAERLTRYLVRVKAADVSAGPYPARLRSWDEAKKAIGWL